MKAQDVHFEDLEQILAMWKEAGGCIPYFISADRIYHDLKIAEKDKFKRWTMGDGYRIGSKWTCHSKLQFWMDPDGELEVRFCPNMDSRFEKGEEEARAAAKAFGKRVAEYLNSKYPIDE